MLKNWLQKRFVNFLVRNLFNSIDAEDILTIAKQRNMYGKEKIIGAYVRKRQLNDVERDSLREGAELFKESSLWKLISNEVKYQANQRMFIYGKEGDDLLAGKIALYNLKVIEEVISKASSL